MDISKKTAAGFVLGGAALATSGYLAVKRYWDYKQFRGDLDLIPWDVPKKYSSWRMFFTTGSGKIRKNTPTAHNDGEDR